MDAIGKRGFCALALGLAAAPFVRGQAPWPARPVRFLVPAAPGSVVDVRARWLAARLAPLLGQPVVIENKPGGGGLLGMEAGARSAPDGYTLVLVHQGVIAVNPFIHAKLPYDPFRDFVPVTRLGLSPLVFVVRPSLGAQTLADFIALARSHRTPLSFGSPGIGTPPHLAAELFRREARIEALHVPYQRGGGGQAAADLIAGHVDFTLEGLTVMLPHVKAGRVHALATTGTRRLETLPEVPTVHEAALPGYTYHGWVGIVAPAGTPGDIVARAHRGIASVLASTEAREWFGAAGADVTPQSPEEFGDFMRAEHRKLGAVIREAGVRAE